MNNYNQRIAYVPSPDMISEEISPWVHLEQVAPSGMSEYASVRDIYRLWMIAAGGQSARHDRAAGYPVEFVDEQIRIFLGFYVWPNPLDLIYQLSPAPGVIGKMINIRKEREFSAFVNNASSLDLPYYMEGVTFVWETPCFNRYGERIEPPSITVTPVRLIFASEVFGCLRVYGTAIGISTFVEITIDKPLEEDKDIKIDPNEIGASLAYVGGEYVPYKPPPANLNSTAITGLSETVTASWLDKGETKTTQLSFRIPKCVEDILKMCPGMYDKFLQICSESDKTMVVYYDGCTGDQKQSKIGKGGSSYCTKIWLQEKPSWMSQEFYDSANT